MDNTVTGIAFTGCTAIDAAQPHAGGRRRQVAVNGRRVRTVDVHAHCVIPEALDLMGDAAKSMRVTVTRRPALVITAADRLNAMDEQGIDP